MANVTPQKETDMATGLVDLQNATTLNQVKAVLRKNLKATQSLERKVSRQRAHIRRLKGLING